MVITKPKKEKKDRRTEIEKEIERAVKRLSELDPASEEYTKLTNTIKILCESDEKKSTHKYRIIEVLLGAGATIAQIAMILGHEYLHNITSKALGFVQRIGRRV